jgi:hypothetical protein
MESCRRCMCQWHPVTIHPWTDWNCSNDPDWSSVVTFSLLSVTSALSRRAARFSFNFASFSWTDWSSVATSSLLLFYSTLFAACGAEILLVLSLPCQSIGIGRFLPCKWSGMDGGTLSSRFNFNRINPLVCPLWHSNTWDLEILIAEETFLETNRVQYIWSVERCLKAWRFFLICHH